MCGLVGIAGDISYDWKDVFTELLIIDSVRGMHSTGVAAVKRFKEKVALLKQPGPSHLLIMNPDYKPTIADQMKVLIGHNRYATIGEHTVANAHPFAFDSVVGAHNGTLHQNAIRRLYEYEKYGTDSEALYSNLNQFGIEDTMTKLGGAWALTWFDINQNSINFLRNDKRPLFYTYSKDHCTLIWASELEMLKFALGRHNKLEKDHQYFVSDIDTHLSWQIPEFQGRSFNSPTKVERKGSPPPAVTYTFYGNGSWKEKDNRQHGYGGASAGNVVPFQGKGQTQTHGTNGGNRSTGTLFDKDKRRNVGKFRPPYKDANGKILNKKLFNILVSQGCVYCEDNSSMWGDFIQPFKDQDSKQVYLCEECYKDDEIFNLCGHMI